MDTLPKEESTVFKLCCICVQVPLEYEERAGRVLVVDRRRLARLNAQAPPTIHVPPSTVLYVCQRCVVGPHRIDVDPDPTFHFNADPT